MKQLINLILKHLLRSRKLTSIIHFKKLSTIIIKTLNEIRNTPIILYNVKQTIDSNYETRNFEK